MINIIQNTDLSFIYFNKCERGCLKNLSKTNNNYSKLKIYIIICQKRFEIIISNQKDNNTKIKKYGHKLIGYEQ